jgi:hypothetical protein
MGRGEYNTECEGTQCDKTAFLQEQEIFFKCKYKISVADPDLSDPYVFGLPVPDPDPLVRCTDPDPYVIKQKYLK